MRASLLLICLLVGSLLTGQEVGLFTTATDVGSVSRPGTTRYDSLEQVYTLQGGGGNVWFDRDSFHYAYREQVGDVILRARARFVSPGGHPHRKLGWMVRASTDPDAAMLVATVHADGLTSLQYRRQTGGDIEELRAELDSAAVIQLERRQDAFIMRVARDGELFETVTLPGMELPDTALVGLFVCAHDDAALETAEFDNVRIVVPPPTEFQVYRDYLGSHIEVLEVQSGRRKIIHSAPNSLQAPNWTPDGETLIYNSEGLLYRIPPTGGTPEELPTGTVRANNNDHVLSFDGEMLGISSSSGEEGEGSLVYTVPVTGGEPKRITPQGPSYLHSWSPDGQWLTYTAERGGQYDLYKMRSDGSGEEVQLTDQATLDDGSEYSPDGQYIYFNSARTGSMELWRMRPDGSEQEQLTDDTLQNWFAHVSPDGQSLIFISYEPEVPASDHPFYKQVYLRTLPIDGGKPRVAAYVFGGQGTMNVPSWSPDGKRVAFVSNTGGIR